LNNLGKKVFYFFAGAVVATVSSLLLHFMIWGLLEQLGPAIAFIGPLLLLWPILIIAPVVACLFAKTVAFRWGAIAAVVIQAAMPFTYGLYISATTASEIKANREVARPSKAPQQVVLDCYGQCYSMVESFVSQSELPLIVLNNGAKKDPILVTKRPAAECMNSNDESSVWNEYLVRAGYIDWCLGFEPVRTPKEGIFFDILPHETTGFGKTLLATEIDGEHKRVLTKWQNGLAPIAGIPPFGIFFPRQVVVGVEFGYLDVIGRVLSLPLKDEIIPASNRDPMREAGWAVANLASPKTAYVANSLLSDSMSSLSTQQRIEIAIEIVSRLGTNKETDQRLINAIWYLKPQERLQFADTLFDRAIMSDGPEAGFSIVLQTPDVDLSHYSKRALEAFDAMILELRKQKDPGQYMGQKFSRFALLFEVLSKGQSGERKAAIEHLSLLDGDALGAVVGSMTYFSNNNGNGGRQLGWTNLEMKHWIDLSNKISGRYLAHYINALRFSDAGRALRPLMLEKMKARLPSISDPDERKIMERLIEVIPTDISS
jgi:hypothetical protein